MKLPLAAGLGQKKTAHDVKSWAVSGEVALNLVHSRKQTPAHVCHTQTHRTSGDADRMLHEKSITERRPALGGPSVDPIVLRYFTPLLASHTPCSLRTITISPV
jgi:hypothetical protein